MTLRGCGAEKVRLKCRLRHKQNKLFDLVGLGACKLATEALMTLFYAQTRPQIDICIAIIATTRNLAKGEGERQR